MRTHIVPVSHCSICVASPKKAYIADVTLVSGCVSRSKYGSAMFSKMGEVVTSWSPWSIAPSRSWPLPVKKKPVTDTFL